MKQLTLLLLSILLITACQSEKPDKNITELQEQDENPELISKWQIDSVDSESIVYYGPFPEDDSIYHNIDITFSFLIDNNYVFKSDSVKRLDTYSEGEHYIKLNKEDFNFIDNTPFMYEEGREEELTWRIFTKNDERLVWHISGGDEKSWKYWVTIFLSRLE